MVIPWGFATTDDPSPILKRVGLITAIAPNKTGRAEGRPIEEVLGCGFVIGAFTERAAQRHYLVICTAAHVLHEAEKWLCPNSVELYGRPFAPARGTLLRRELPNRTLHVLMAADERSNPSFHVCGIDYFHHADLAYVIAETPVAHSGLGQPLMLIDSDPRPVGTQVTLIGAPKSTIQIESSRGIRSRVHVSPKWHGRNGIISQALPRSRLTNTPVYETTIQAPAGMSGGPVLLTHVNEGAKSGIENVAIGVLSHELPDDEPESVERRGYSYVIPAASMYGLKAPTPFFQPNQPRTLAQVNLMKDVGLRSGEISVDWSAADVIVRRDTDCTIRDSS